MMGFPLLKLLASRLLGRAAMFRFANPGEHVHASETSAAHHAAHPLTQPAGGRPVARRRAHPDAAVCNWATPPPSSPSPPTLRPPTFPSTHAYRDEEEGKGDTA
jgi:hypothetical protein